MSIGANNKDLQKAAVKALGEYFGDSRNQDKGDEPSYKASLAMPLMSMNSQDMES